MNEDVFLTGGSGFVGAAIHALARRTSISMRAPTHREADILRPETLEASMRGASTVIHAAGAAHLFDPTPASEAALWQTNVDGTRNVVRAARRVGARHVILVSSVAVYSPEGAYATSKVQAEAAAIEEAGTFLPLTILRLATVYGEGDRGNVLRLIRLIDRRRFVWIGRGENRKSLIDRDEAAAAILLATKSIPTGREVFNVTAPAVAMRDVVAAIAMSLDRTLPRWRIDERVARASARALTALTLHSRRAVVLERTIAKWIGDDVYDGSAFEARFGFRPTVTLEEGIAREVAWYRASRALPSISRGSEQP